MNSWMTGASIGALGGLGWWLIVWVGRHRTITLMERISPYLRERPRGSRLLTPVGPPSPLGPLAATLQPLAADLSGWLSRLGSTEESVAARLRESGRAISPDQFRLEQLAWASLGASVGLAAALASASRGGKIATGIVLVVIAAVAGGLGADHALSRAAAKRTERIVAELPELAELAALSVGAGEGPVQALARISRIAHGDLAREFGEVVARTRTGVPFARAMEELARSTQSAELSRFADAIVVAAERGTPLAAVLRAQADDLRESSRARLLEVGGTKETAMLAPVVFLILPVTVIFALFPGLSVLEVGW